MQPGWPRAPKLPSLPGDSLRGAEPGWRRRAQLRAARTPSAHSCPPAPAHLVPAQSSLTAQTRFPTPRALSQCQQQFPGRPGDSSLSQPRGNPMPWRQQRVPPGVWGMGLRLCRAELPEGQNCPPHPPTAPCPFHTLWRQSCPLPCTQGPWPRRFFPDPSWKMSPTPWRQCLSQTGQALPPPVGVRALLQGGAERPRPFPSRF